MAGKFCEWELPNEVL